MVTLLACLPLRLGPCHSRPRPPPSLLLLPLLLALGLALCPWASHGKAHKSLLVRNAEPAETSAHVRGIVSESLHYKTVLFEHSRHWSDVSHRHFNGTVLAYVTPWNSRGYDVALKFRDKFTHVSPVWYQLKGEASGLELGGADGVNRDWAAKLKSGDTSIKLTPRFLVEGHPEFVLKMVQDKDWSARAIQLVLQECQANKYDGVVLEAWSTWTHSGVLDDPETRAEALDFVKDLAETLSSQDPPLETFLVMAPPGTGRDIAHVFTAADFSLLAPHVAGFSLMTYDFSSPYSPGPNAPIKWLQSTLAYLLPHVRPKHIEEFHHYSRELRSTQESDGEDELAAKVLLGLNFYGNKFQKPSGGGPIVGHEYLDLVDKHRPSIRWDDASKEHHFTVSTETGSKFDVYFPTLMSIQVRLDEARAWGTGISIWELGQGLDFFYDLL